MSVGKKFKICMLTKATAATQAQAPQLREKFGRCEIIIKKKKLLFFKFVSIIVC